MQITYFNRTHSCQSYFNKEALFGSINFFPKIQETQKNSLMACRWLIDNLILHDWEGALVRRLFFKSYEDTCLVAMSIAPSRARLDLRCHHCGDFDDYALQLGLVNHRFNSIDLLKSLKGQLLVGDRILSNRKNLYCLVTHK